MASRMAGDDVERDRIGVEGTIGEQDCPVCGARITYDRAFVPWCRACRWNVDAGLLPRDPPSRLDKIWKSLGRRAGDSLYRQLLTSPIDRPRFTISLVAAYAISIAVYAVWFAILLAGLWLIFLAGNGVLLVLGIVVTLLAVVSRPRFTKLKEPPTRRAEAPELYALLDDIAGALQAPRIHTVWITSEWNASTFRFGLRQRTGVLLGLPLWASVDHDQRTALLGHEVAHGVNGDTTRSIVVGNALEALVTWAYILEPVDLTGGDPGIVGIASIPLNLLAMVASKLLIGIASGLVLLIYRNSQRAEFYADSLAASLAGSDGAIRMLEATNHGAAYRRAQGAVVTGDRWHTFFDELARQIRITPESELERVSLGEAKLGSSLDATHPPTHQRIELLRTHPRPRTRNVLSADRSARIDAELAPIRERISREVAEAYLLELS